MFTQQKYVRAYKQPRTNGTTGPVTKPVNPVKEKQRKDKAEKDFDKKTAEVKNTTATGASEKVYAQPETKTANDKAAYIANTIKKMEKARAQGNAVQFTELEIAQFIDAFDTKFGVEDADGLISANELSRALGYLQDYGALSAKQVENFRNTYTAAAAAAAKDSGLYAAGGDKPAHQTFDRKFLSKVVNTAWQGVDTPQGAQGQNGAVAGNANDGGLDANGMPKYQFLYNEAHGLPAMYKGTVGKGAMQKGPLASGYNFGNGGGGGYGAQPTDWLGQVAYNMNRWFRPSYTPPYNGSSYQNGLYTGSSYNQNQYGYGSGYNQNSSYSYNPNQYGGYQSTSYTQPKWWQILFSPNLWGNSSRTPGINPNPNAYQRWEDGIDT